MGIHVDDDLMAGNEAFYRIAVPRLRRRFIYGSWKTMAGGQICFCGIDMHYKTMRDALGKSTPALLLSQSNYA